MGTYRIGKTWVAVLLGTLLLGLALGADSAPQQRTAGPRAVFDHLTTGFEIIGRHRDLTCESCHVNAIFKGTPKDCASCHGVGTAVRATAKPRNHILSSNRCEACHSPIGFAPAVTFDHAEARGSCSTCHNGVQAPGKGPTHIATNLECDACHSTIGWAGAVFNHTGVTSGCASCHNGVQASGLPATHIPTVGAPCEACHTNTNNFTTWVGAVINHPSVAGEACASCHEAGDATKFINVTIVTRPAAPHPTTGDCVTCHDTTTFLTSGTRPANHLPTSAPCYQCHTTTGNYALYSVTGVHQGVTSCLSCHASTVNATFANITITTTSATHIPIGSLDCNAAGCHSTANVNPGGFLIGAASITSPTLTIAGHSTVAAAVTGCASCHETAPYQGMIASTATAAGDSRPQALDPIHPATGDCGSCHTTTPTFGGDLLTSAKPANHIPTSAACTQCHTTSGNYAAYSVTATHQGVTTCVNCHGSTVNTTFANVTPVTTTATHIPIGSLDCNGAGCHSTANVNPGGFLIGAANTTSPTLTAAGHATVAAAVAGCASCHETAPYQGMIASTATLAGDSRPQALDPIHPATGDCGSCHTTTPTFGGDLTSSSKPANHIPTTAPCAQCHTTSSNYAAYSVTGTHQGVTTCVNCHGSTVNTTFANVTIVTTTATHIPIGSLDCNGAGCHSTANVNPGGFLIGAASITSPTLSAAGHTTIVAAVAACQTCHETAPYQGMIASTTTVAGDSRPSATLDAAHPTTGDCGGCHTTSPLFNNNVVTGTKPANHIPTSAPCAQCHTTASNLALYSVTGTHQGVTTCVNCHGSTVNTTFANITITTTPSSHFPIGSLDCNGAGCHTTTNVNPGGFLIGTANINSPTLTVPGHTTVAAAVTACSSCHETAPYVGMIASTATAAGDSRPTALDKNHPTSGDCGTCHTTTPTFGSDITTSAKPANHIPTSAACTQCHTTAGNYAAYSVTGTHQGVTGCLSCHGSTVNTTFANVTIATTPSNHFPIASLDCNGAGCHTTANVNPGGFLIGTANISTPTLTVAGHTTVAAGVAGCQTCHQSAAYVGMIASTNTTAGDSRPSSVLDASHPTTGDCNGCHTTTPTFATDLTGTAAKPTNHIPTTQTCSLCHTTAGNYAAYVMGTTGHTGITSGCATCHASGKSFANMAPPTLVEPPTGPTGHIPVGTVACEQCHSTAVFTTFSGTVMKHAAVRGNACDSCHELGMTWKTNTGVPLWVRRSANHYAGKDCGGGGCHTPQDRHARRPGTVSRPATAVSNTSTAGAPKAATATAGATAPAAGAHPPIPAGAACVSCHTAASSIGKPAGHIATTDACQACHTTVAWMPLLKVDHLQVRGTCVSCHNGLAAQGKPVRHIASNTQCDSCHTTNAWTPARFQHPATAAGTCRSCHDSVHAIGMPVAHVLTKESCDTCHGTLAWTPARLDHSRVAGVACASCHNRVNATGKPATHLVTQADCATCHTYPDWHVVTRRTVAPTRAAPVQPTPGRPRQ
jgi:hypothetical protein